jgi:hypothetical protein
MPAPGALATVTPTPSDVAASSAARASPSE